jgi:hypothetical protein
MGIDLRMPSITGATDREQLAQIRSYLYQFIPQLQWALNNIDTASASNQVAQQVQVQRVATGSSTANALDTFNAIKSLIITSADIVNAYYDEVNKRLAGLYVAESDFGTYAQATEQRITENSTGLTQAFTNIQTVESSLHTEMATNIDAAKTELSQSIGDVDDRVTASEKDVKYIKDTIAYIKTGELYYVKADGTESDDPAVGNPVYGLEIRQEDSENGSDPVRRMARFTSRKLSFFDSSGLEVAWISGLKLYIKVAEITYQLKVGGYVDEVGTDGGVVTKWVGGE